VGLSPVALQGEGGRFLKGACPCTRPTFRCAPDEHLREVATILAAGLLRFRIRACAALTPVPASGRPHIGATSDMSGERAAAKQPAETSQKTLGLPATPRPDPPAG